MTDNELLEHAREILRNRRKGANVDAMIKLMTYAIYDHQDGDCGAEPGKCIAVLRARSIIAGRS